MKWFNSLLVIALGFGAVGCGHTDLSQAMLRPVEPGRGGARAHVYLGSQKPPHLFYEVALVQAVATGNAMEFGAVVDSLAVRAGKLGCDAIVRVSYQRGATVAVGYGVCVRFTGQTRPPGEGPWSPAEGNSDGDEEGKGSPSNHGVPL
jgi:hypothetical protein